VFIGLLKTNEGILIMSSNIGAMAMPDNKAIYLIRPKFAGNTT